jgi:hypothetical protein
LPLVWSQPQPLQCNLDPAYFLTMNVVAWSILPAIDGH